MKVKVDSSKCAASGDCIRIAEDLFESDEWGYSQPVGDGTVPAGREEAALQAVRECPRQAISTSE
jgi:ferredoxin